MSTQQDLTPPTITDALTVTKHPFKSVIISNVWKQRKSGITTQELVERTECEPDVIEQHIGELAEINLVFALPGDDGDPLYRPTHWGHALIQTWLTIYRGAQ